MAYDATTLMCVYHTPVGYGPSLFVHKSADATTAADASGFITNGGKYGMKAGDMLWHTDITSASAPIVSSHYVLTVNSTTGAVNLSNGTVIGSGTDSD